MCPECGVVAAPGHYGRPAFQMVYHLKTVLRKAVQYVQNHYNGFETGLFFSDGLET